MVVRIRLDTSDFTVERSAGGRVSVQIDGPTDAVILDPSPLVAVDLMLMLIEPEEFKDV